MSGADEAVIGSALESWRSLRGNELKRAKEKLAASLTREMCVEYFSQATSAEVLSFNKEVEALLSLGANIALAAATLDDAVRWREEIKGALSSVRRSSSLLARSPLALCKRFPDANEVILEALKNDHLSVGDLRWILENVRPQLNEALIADRHASFLDDMREVSSMLEERRAWMAAIPVDLVERLDRHRCNYFIKLGATWSAAAAPTKFPSVYRSGHGYWTVDPLGELDAPKGFGWEVVTRLRLPAGSYRSSLLSFWGPPRETDVGFGGVMGEVVDTYVDRERVILQPIAYEPESQYMLAINIVSLSDDPEIYSIDHDGTGPSERSTFVGMMRDLVEHLG